MDKAAKKDPVVTGSEEVNAGHLRAFIERIERLEEEKKALSDDIKDVYAEAKGNGFDVKIMRKIVAIRKQDREKRRERGAGHALKITPRPVGRHACQRGWISN